jgi:hypothetical protein
MSHQSYIEGMIDHVQTEMLAEFTGKDGHKCQLIDATRIKARQAAEPLPGQANIFKGGTDAS